MTPTPPLLSLAPLLLQRLQAAGQAGGCWIMDRNKRHGQWDQDWGGATPKSKSLLASLIKPSYKVKLHQIIQIWDNLSLAADCTKPPPPLQILTLQLTNCTKRVVFNASIMYNLNRKKLKIKYLNQHFEENKNSRIVTVDNQRWHADMTCL